MTIRLGISHVLLEKSEKTITTYDGEKVRSRIDLGPDGILIGLSLPYTRKRSTDATNGRRDRTANKFKYIWYIQHVQLCQFEIESSTVAINVRRLVI